MSKEYNPNPALEAVKWVLGTAVGVGLSLGVAVAAHLVAEHLKRLSDANLLRVPWNREKLIQLGPSRVKLNPVKPPEAEYTIRDGRAAPVPGLNLSGLIEVGREQ